MSTSYFILISCVLLAGFVAGMFVCLISCLFEIKRLRSEKAKSYTYYRERAEKFREWMENVDSGFVKEAGRIADIYASCAAETSSQHDKRKYLDCEYAIRRVIDSYKCL